MRVGNTAEIWLELVYWWWPECETVHSTGVLGRARGAFLACPNTKRTSLCLFLVYVMQVSISSLQSTFSVSPVVAVHHLSQHRLWLCRLLLCLRPGVRLPPSVFVGSASETLKSEADALEGICNGRKKQHSFTSSGLLLLHRATNGSDNQDGVWQQHCEEVYLMLLWLRAGAVDQAEHQTTGWRVKSHVSSPRTASLECSYMHRVMRFVLPCTRRQRTRKL